MTFTAFNGRIYNPDLKFSGAGKAYFTCTIQENHRDKNRETGNYEKCGTTWHRVTYFGNKLYTPEALAEQAVEGATAVVYGESKKKEYPKKDGTPGEAQEIIPEPGAFGVTATAPEYANNGQQGGQQARGGNAGGFSGQQSSGGFGGHQGGAQPAWGGHPSAGFGQDDSAPF